MPVVEALRVHLLLLFTVGLLLNLSAQAAEKHRLLFSEDGKYAPFVSKPANEIMTEREYKEYRSSLSKLDCEQALTILNAAFVRSYPQFNGVRKDVADEKEYWPWEMYAYTQFTELGHCHSVARVQEIENKMKATNFSPPKYVFREIGEIWNDPPLVRSRNLAISSLLDAAQNDYGPALVRIAELVRRGDLFDVGGDVEFYLLTRTCRLGHDCASFQGRLDELAESLPRSKRTEIVEKARADESIVESLFSGKAKL